MCNFWLSVYEEPDDPGLTYEWKVFDRGCVEHGGGDLTPNNYSFTLDSDFSHKLVLDLDGGEAGF